MDPPARLAFLSLALIAAPLLPAQDDARVVFLVGEREYGSEHTMPRLAAELEERLGLEVSLRHGTGRSMPEPPLSEEADLLVLFLRFREPGDEQLAKLEAWLDAGKPAIALRTTSHLFWGEALKGWFPPRFGGHYKGHATHERGTEVVVSASHHAHPVLRGLPASFSTPHGGVYFAQPLADGAEPLLFGRSGDLPSEPVAWTYGLHPEQRLFSTSLGTEADFALEPFRRLLANAVLWCLEREVPATGAPGFGGVPAERAASDRTPPPPPALDAPADATVLFGGAGLEEWRHWDPGLMPRAIHIDERADTSSGGPRYERPRWRVENGALVARPGFGDLLTEREFGDDHLHLDFLVPAEPPRRPDAFRGIGGVFLSGLWEVRIADSAGSPPTELSTGAITAHRAPSHDAARPAGVWQSLDVRFEHRAGGPAHATVWLNGEIVQDDVALEEPTPGAFLGGVPGRHAGKATPWYATEAGPDSAALAWDEGDFAVAVRFRSQGDGTLASKCPPEGPWAPDAKALFLRAGRLTYDIGWVGYLEGSSRLDDGVWHNVVLRNAGERAQLFVDGALESERVGFSEPDDEGFVFKVGAANFDFAGDFEDGLIEEVLYFDGAISEAEARAWSGFGEFEQQPDFVWDGEEKSIPAGDFDAGALVTGPIRLNADVSEVRYANVWFRPLERVDHAALIRGWDESAFERGRALYLGTCVSCHGSDGRKLPNPQARAFAVAELENGSDPLSLYRTIREGFRDMPSNAWLTSEQTYDLVHFIREEFLREANPEQYSAAGAAYLNTLPKGRLHGPEEDGELAPRDWGPALASQLGENLGACLTVRLADDVSIAYDLQRMISPAVWKDGFLDLSETQHDKQRGEGGARVQGSRLPPLAGFGWGHGGTLDWDRSRRRPRAPLPREWLDYRGHFLHQRNVVLSYAIDGRGVLELPGLEWAESAPVITHRFRVEAGEQELLLQLGSRPRGIADPQTVLVDEWMGTRVAWRALLERPAEAAAPFTAAGVLGLAAQPAIDPQGRLVLRIPARDEPLEFLILRCTSSFEDELEEFLTLLAEFGARELPPSPRALTAGGPPRWPVEITTRGALGSERPYALDTLPLPGENPWNAWLRTSALDFFEDGRAAVSTYGGDVWIVTGIDTGLGELRWRRFAAGMFEPMGLKIVDGLVHVTCRDRITRLHDLDADGEADFYESFFPDPDVSPNFHAFNFDLQADDDGYLYYAKSGQYTDFHLPGAVLRVAPDGRSHEVWCTGLRTPNGMGMSPEGRPLVSDNQGNWVPASKVTLTERGGFYGVFKAIDTNRPGRQTRPDFDPPAVWMPQALDSSSGGQLWIDDARFGPLSGRYLHTSFGKGWMYGLVLDEAAEPVQGAVWKLPFQFDAGLQRLRRNPADGQVYAVGLSGWQGPPGGADGCLQRLRWTRGGRPLLIGAQVVPAGVELEFSAAVDPARASDPSRYRAARWNYRWSRDYGSAHYSIERPGREGEDPVSVQGAEVLRGGRVVRLALDHVVCDQLLVEYRLFEVEHPLDDEVYFTVHRLPGP